MAEDTVGRRNEFDDCATERYRSGPMVFNVEKTGNGTENRKSADHAFTRLWGSISISVSRRFCGTALWKNRFHSSTSGGIVGSCRNAVTTI
jgi:hypothetical protein